MTSYATRSPLQTLTMTSSQRSTRRSSTRLLEREEALLNGHSSAGTAGRQQQANGKVGAGAASKKRKPDYDEEDDGFLFTRTRSKRAKAARAVPLPETIVEERQEPVSVPTRPRKGRSSDTVSAPDKEDQGLKVRKKRNAGTSGEKRPVEKEEEKAKGGRRAEGKHDGKDHQTRPIEGPSNAAQRAGEAEDSIDIVGGISHVERSRDATKIALPFADTPVIRRNKEMRKGADTGHRRSSLSMRGRRASSLIDGGKSNALPHDEVDIADFYKHIESDGLPEPRRMKQLLTWCGTRAMGQKPGFSSEDSNARLAARVIQEELLKDFSTRSEMSDWFNREETAPVTLVKKLNPKNTSNATRIQDLEAQIKRLQEERKTWEDLLKPPKENVNDNDEDSKDAPSIPVSTSTSKHPPPPSLPTFDPTFLSPEQLSILETLTSQSPTTMPPIQTNLTIPSLPSTTKPTTTTTPTSRLRTLTSTLEPTIDALADGIHKLAQYTNTADRVASRVLATAAEVLDEREREGRKRGGAIEGVGVGEVLRGLSRFEG